MYKYILMDLDNTLLDFNAGERDAFNKVLESERMHYSDELIQRYQQINGKLWQDLEAGNITRQQLLDTRFQKFFGSIGRTVDGVEKERIFRVTLNDSHVLIEGALALLQYLKSKDMIICSATNGVYHTQIQRMQASGIYEYFNHHFISEEIGYEKPDIRFFEHCFNTLQLDNQQEVLMIGDTLTSDILGAKNAGIDSCYFGFKASDATYTVRTLKEIEDII
ncbi:YjjG family noncanonical pyrimidine nucleotidase [Macrococcus capreoli]